MKSKPKQIIPEFHTSDNSTPIFPVPGLVFIDKFIDANDENNLIKHIDDSPWNDKMRRRVQHHGWRYDYLSREVTDDMYLGPLPAFLDTLSSRIHTEGYMQQKPDQVIINEYVASQGISRHIDSNAFGPEVATLSLLESWFMTFHHKSDLDRHIYVRLNQRSLTVLTGPSRTDFFHELSRSYTEPNAGMKSRFQRQRRISLTFRTVPVKP